MAEPRRPAFFEAYTRDLTSSDLQRLFTRDTRDAYRFFAQGLDDDALKHLPLPRRILERTRQVFIAFTLKLSPARRALYGVALLAAVLGLLQLFAGFEVSFAPIGLIWVPVVVPTWSEGTILLLLGFLLTNLLVLLEVADRLSLKNELEVARDIQQAMLPRDSFHGPGVEAHGQTRPANTVGGDFYDILPLPDGRVVVALGDVAGKGSPAALLMALLLAMLRTLLDEGLTPEALMQRLNTQVRRHAPPSRFITLFFSVFDPVSGRLVYVNAGHLPPLVRRADGGVERLMTGGIALGLFDGSTYQAAETVLTPGDLVVLYSDGITEAESPQGEAFEEAGLMRVIESNPTDTARALCTSVITAVGQHAQDTRFADDLTVVVLKRHLPLPA